MMCLCLLAISASAFPSSTVFCCASLPLLLHECTFFARFLIPSQAKLVAVKRHRKRVRLKRIQWRMTASEPRFKKLEHITPVEMLLPCLPICGMQVSMGPSLWQWLLPCLWWE
jgi:hypothetical protein